MMQAPRQNFVRLYVGKNSIGKTPTAIYDVMAYQRAFPKKKIIVFDSQDKFKDAHDRGDLRVDLLIPRNNKGWAGVGPDGLQYHTEPSPGKKIYKWRNSLLILDDYRMLLRGNDMPSNFYDLFALRPREHFNMDMIMICHEPRNILRGVAGYITHYHIFANEASAIQYDSERISCYVKCQQASLVINKYASMYGKGYYDVKTQTPYFPHIVVEKERPEPLQCYNMELEKAKPILTEFTNKKAA